MKSTSRSSRLVSSAARSPALAITGPEVARNPTPSSLAMICASVVLPRPGGPGEQHVIERIAARLGGLDEHLEVGARLLLADELVERLRPDGRLEGVCSFSGGGEQPIVAHDGPDFGLSLPQCFARPAPLAQPRGRQIRARTALQVSVGQRGSSSTASRAGFLQPALPRNVLGAGEPSPLQVN